MAASLLGADQVLGLIDSNIYVVISNRTSEQVGIQVLSVAVVLHGEDGSRQLRAAHALRLGPGESKVLADFPLTAASLVAAEMGMRLLDVDRSRVMEAYAMAEAAADERLGSVEFGVVETRANDASDATPLPDAPELAVFARIEP